MTTETPPVVPATPPRVTLRARLAKAWDSDLAWSFRHSPVAIVATAMTVLLLTASLCAGWIAPQNAFDPAAINLLDAYTKPGDTGMGSNTVFWLGTDNQGRDLFSAILYGSRVSLFVGFLSVAFSVVMGVGLGLISGYVGGRTDAFIMRVADIQLSFPAILIALLFFGVARGVIPPSHHEQMAIWVLIVAIGLSNWAQYARTVRGSTMVERNKEYVQAARVMGRPALFIMARHVLPNVTGPVLVIATINLALAIIEEATLSFLGVGVPATQPSLGTLIRFGQQYLFSGEWWILFFPALALVLLALSINLLGDWLRDALNPRLR
ncbi:ABC transporter permease [Phreatobacter oligotrophus]|uniref:ABC transporter permease n=1 Tax=Phreatobacter oligotrophus TaxID=1122261 RepID=UPI0023532FCF|nr:ABC transporter permease [Phreatobacter oligotrophus]MBX9992940.1 ABC transporter permease [Phreatobacter oligotrophus]